MSINFYKTILLVVFCLSFISPIKLQAYCQFEGCVDSSNLDEAPLTLQEAQEIKEFYTSVEHSLSENLEVLSDGTYQVSFPKNILSAGAGILGAGLSPYAIQQIESDILWKTAFEAHKAEEAVRDLTINEKTNKFLNNYLRTVPDSRVEWSSEYVTAFIGDNSRGVHRIRIHQRVVYGDIEETARTYVDYYRKSGGQWIMSDTYSWVDYGKYDFKEDLPKYETKIRTLIHSLQAKDPQVFENYLKARGVSFVNKIRKSRMWRASRFVGRWTFRAVLAGASIVGGQLLFDYAQENHPEETGLVIAITKEQWEILSTNVRGIIEELSENNNLNELEL